jgi:hypothetical protein
LPLLLKGERAGERAGEEEKVVSRDMSSKFRVMWSEAVRRDAERWRGVAGVTEKRGMEGDPAGDWVGEE